MKVRHDRTQSRGVDLHQSGARSELVNVAFGIKRKAVRRHVNAIGINVKLSLRQSTTPLPDGFACDMSGGVIVSPLRYISTGRES